MYHTWTVSLFLLGTQTQMVENSHQNTTCFPWFATRPLWIFTEAKTLQSCWGDPPAMVDGRKILPLSWPSQNIEIARLSLSKCQANPARGSWKCAKSICQIRNLKNLKMAMDPSLNNQRHDLPPFSIYKFTGYIIYKLFQWFLIHVPHYNRNFQDWAV